MLRLLKNKSFTLLWAGHSLSTIGDWIRNMSLTFWAYEVSGHSPTATAGMAIANALPAILCGPIAGTLMRQWSQRRVMFWARLVCAACSAVLAFLTLGHSMWAALAVAFISSTAAEFYYPARQAMVPAIVERDQVVEANSLSQMTFNLALVLGPVVGTSIHFSVGPQWALALDAVTFALAGISVHLADLPANIITSVNGFKALLADMNAGFVYVWKTRAIRYTTIAFSMAMFAWAIDNICQLYLITRNLGLPEASFSLTMSAWGAVMIFASIFVFSLAKRLTNMIWLVSGGLVLTGLYIVGIGLSPSLTWILILTIPGGIGNAALSIGANSLLQTTAAESMLTRVFGVYSPVVTGASLLGSWAGGMLAKYIDVRWVFMASGLVILLVAVWLLLTLTATQRNSDNVVEKSQDVV